MIRNLLFATTAIALSSVATAQMDASSQIRPITGPIKDAGTYHVATGTWTRAKSPTANLGSSTLYNNTCFPGFYFALSSLHTMVDSGRLPSTSSTDVAAGTGDSYQIDGFTIAYCAVNAAVDVTVAHYECYSPCADATALTPMSSVDLSGLPGGGGSALGCWVLDIDLTGSTSEFSMAGDCDGSFGGSSGADNFGWSYTETNPGGNAGGPLLAGDPLGLLGAGPTGTGCAYGDGTVFVGQDLSTPGTGIGAEDVFETDAGGAYGGCWFFGGYTGGAPFSSFGHALSGAAEGGGDPGVGTSYCSGTGCPCANDSTNGGGCANGSGDGAVLSGSGSNSAGAADLGLNASGLIAGEPGLYFQGENAVNSGNGNAFGDGLRCAGFNVVRLEIVTADAAGDSASTIDIVAKGGVVAGDLRRYQLWYRDPQTSPCGGLFNLSNGLEITWGA